MKTEDLILSLGEVSPEFLEQSEKTPHKKGKSVLRIALIAAAIIALGATVTAIGGKHIFGLELEKTHNEVIMKEEALSASADIILDVKMDQDAPSSLEEYYLPLMPAQEWEIQSCSANRFSSLLSCEKGSNYLVFQQIAAPDYRGQYSIDTVDLGYDASYESYEECIGGVDVFTVAVEPSRTYPDQGRRKHYWSDGRYLFVLEVNYDMEMWLREEIFESISQVDLEEYLKEPREPVSVLGRWKEIETPMYPTTFPQGWVEGAGGRQPDGSYVYYWHPESEEQIMSVVAFVQTGNASYYQEVQRDWAQRTDAFSCEEQDGICIYTAQGQTQIIWQQDGYYFSLDSVGEHYLSGQELLAVAKSVK